MMDDRYFTNAQSSTLADGPAEPRDVSVRPLPCLVEALSSPGQVARHT